ncbi:MAG TPA: DNA repair protein RecO [Ktedonobacteraceae bacterium]|nr:DNA repair protein RecO [Ktedonobacteraceae bacterium]
MRQQHSYSTEAIILKRTDLGEADRIVTLFTPRKGKFHAVAKGSRRPVSKLAGHLDLLCRSQLQIAQGRNLDIVTQAEVRENFLRLRTELWHMTCGFYLAELVDRFVEEHVVHSDIYTLLLQTLRYLDTDASVPGLQQMAETNKAGLQVPGKTSLLLRYFELHLLSALGYAPSLQNCVSCSSELLPQENGFKASLGGVLCSQCSHLWERRLSLNAFKVLRYLQKQPWNEASRVRLNAPLEGELEAVMHSLLRFHLERDLKSWSFLEMLAQPPRVQNS